MQWYLNPSLHIYKNLSSEHLSSELTLALQYTTDLNAIQQLPITHEFANSVLMSKELF